MQKSVIDNESVFNDLRTATHATLRPELGRNISVAAVPDLSGFLVFDQGELDPAEWSVLSLDRREMQQLTAFVAEGYTPEEGLCYLQHEPELLRQMVA